MRFVGLIHADNTGIKRLVERVAGTYETRSAGYGAMELAVDLPTGGRLPQSGVTLLDYSESPAASRASVSVWNIRDRISRPFAELEELNERRGLHLSSAFGSLPTYPQGGEDILVAHWDAVLKMQRKALKGLPPALKELQDCFRPPIRPGVGENVEGLPFHVRMDLERARELTAIHRIYCCPDLLHVLLRHGLLREPGDFESLLPREECLGSAELAVAPHYVNGEVVLKLDLAGPSARVHPTEPEKCVPEVANLALLEAKSPPRSPR